MIQVETKIDSLQETRTLDNKVLQSVVVLDMKTAIISESSSSQIKYLTQKLPVLKDVVPAIITEWTMFQCSQLLKDCEDGDVVTQFRALLAKKQVFLNLVNFFKALLAIPHGSADIERGFSVNKSLVTGRAALGIESMAPLGVTLTVVLKCSR